VLFSHYCVARSSHFPFRAIHCGAYCQPQKARTQHTPTKYSEDETSRVQHQVSTTSYPLSPPSPSWPAPIPTPPTTPLLRSPPTPNITNKTTTTNSNDNRDTDAHTKTNTNTNTNRSNNDDKHATTTTTNDDDDDDDDNDNGQRRLKKSAAVPAVTASDVKL